MRITQAILLFSFYKDGKYYSVYGSHCSCHGLEGQWDPVEETAQTIVHYVEKGAYDSQLLINLMTNQAFMLAEEGYEWDFNFDYQITPDIRVELSIEQDLNSDNLFIYRKIRNGNRYTVDFSTLQEDDVVFIIKPTNRKLVVDEFFGFYQHKS